MSSETAPTPSKNVLTQWSPVMAFNMSVLAGVIEKAATYPLDVVKTRLQLQTEVLRKDRHYRGIYRTAKTVLREEGWRRMYRGVTVAMAAFPLQLAARVYANEHAKRYVIPNGLEVQGASRLVDSPQLYARLIGVGALCGLAEAPFIAPFDTVKIKLQAYVPAGRPDEYSKNISEAVRKLWREGKMKRLYSGFSSVALRQMVYGASVLPAYQYFTSAWVVAPEGAYGFKLVLCGTAAGLVSAFVGAPFDTIKTRMQKREPGYERILPTISKIVREEGLLSLYRGGRAMMAQVWFGTFLSLWTYETLVRKIISPDSFQA